MSREKIIRILCAALVTTVLSLALILMVAVIGGMTAAGPAEEEPHFRPFFPEGSFDLGDIAESIDPEDFTLDPDGTLDPDMTLPPEPEGSLPDWESGWEWPTLPPSLEIDTDFEWPTLPEDWGTLPEEWGTLPEDWGDIPLDPDGLADLLTGMNGSLGLPPGALAAGVASQLTVMEIYAERADRLYLKMQSFGKYTGQGWEEAEAFGMGYGPLGYSALYIPHYLMNRITPFGGYPLTVTPVMDVRVIPYYITDEGDASQLQPNDVKAEGTYGQPYTLYYRPYGTHVYAPQAEPSVAAFESAYAEFVRQGYLEVDDTTLAYLKFIIDEQGFESSDPDIVAKVATYVQNAAVYNLAYDQNLDKEPNVALAFLGAYKEGVCRHFASAATLLYRALGIPARYTVGFMTDVEAYGTTAVRGKDAHAWVEVYEEGFGWRFVEVTGSSAGNNPEGPGTDSEPETEPDTKPITHKVTLKPVNMAVKYNGETVNHNGILSGFEEYEALGYTYQADVSGGRATCGTTSATIEAVTVYDPNGLDVTEQFTITKRAGTITVYRFEVSYASLDLSKTYDGLPARATEVKLIAGALPEGYTVEVVPTYTQTSVGTGYAAFNLIFWYEADAGGEPVDRTDEFLVHKQYGTLTVTHRALTVRAADAEKVYDGEALTANRIEIIGGTLAVGDFLDSYTVEGSQTRVGRSENLVTDMVIRNQDGEDVTRSYVIETIAGTLKVTSP